MPREELSAALPAMPVAQFDIREVGHVSAVRESLVRVEGLPTCRNGQRVEFANGTGGIVMGFTEQEVQILVFGQRAALRLGDEVYNKGESFTIPVGEAFLGRLVNGLCEPMDEGGPVPAAARLPVFGNAPGVMDRVPVRKTLETGTMLIDALIPIAKGQRQLLIGDRMTGKTTVAIDAMLSQHGQGVICIYCCIGKNHASLIKLLQLLKRRGALASCIIVNGSASTSVGEQFLAPYTACTLGEAFMRQGRDVLVVFDDLTKHAWAYRQISLLLERAPGREAYPGDIFYVHSQLMERAGFLTPELGGGSMTFLPICDILQGDVTGYVSSNLVSMTDGQIYFNTSLFNRGLKPAIDLGLSVSRIGSKAQWPAMKELSGSLRLEYVKYQELLRMTQLRTAISAEAEAQLRRGEAITQLFLQDKHRPRPIVDQIVELYALRRSVLDQLSARQIQEFKAQCAKLVRTWHPEVIEELQRSQTLTPRIKQLLDESVKRYVHAEEPEGAAAAG